jgi:periplasmic divalent cation tolerance protein
VNHLECRSTYRWSDNAGGDATGSDAIQRDDEVLLLAKTTRSCCSRRRRGPAAREDDEVLLLAKTTSDRYGALAERVRELHPYDVPCIERFDETGMLDAYADWVADATQPRE